MMDIFSILYLFLIGFLIGFLFSGFVISDFLQKKVDAIEKYFSNKKKENEKVKEEEEFKKFINIYVNKLKRKK